ncbi:hypothetical protein T484DRAFT_1749893 [Baffinella frigidus]|nr:hypothetical protein T484DRAFT_1749893 [Cryptophyta sp. CCMP2293]
MGGKRKVSAPASDANAEAVIDATLHRWLSATPVINDALKLLPSGDLEIGGLVLEREGGAGVPVSTHAVSGDGVSVSWSVRLWDDERQWCEVTKEEDDGESVEVSVFEAGVLPLDPPLFAALASLQHHNIISLIPQPHHSDTRHRPAHRDSGVQLPFV